MTKKCLKILILLYIQLSRASILPHHNGKKIEIEALYHALTNAGHISYMELAGDVALNPGAFEAVILHMKECGIGCGSVNHPVDADSVCGYNGIIGDTCPCCGWYANERVETERMIRNK